MILHLQDLVPDAALSVGMMREGTTARLGRMLERFVYMRSDQITVISQGFVDNLLDKGVPKSKLRLLPNWVDVGRFVVLPDDRVRAAFGATNGQTLVVHAGNMGAKQGLETLVEAAALDESVAIALIGDGSQRRDLEGRATRLGLKNLKFLPLQSDLPAALAAADVLVLSQQRRVIDSVAPSKLLSYMAAGKPIVAAVNELSEAARIIYSARCGVVVAPEQPSALVSAIHELRSRPEHGRRFGEAGRAYASAQFDRTRILDMWSAALDA
jgi:colanic acid biosynthesis glycosyl transferase WcaI